MSFSDRRSRSHKEPEGGKPCKVSSTLRRAGLRNSCGSWLCGSGLESLESSSLCFAIGSGLESLESSSLCFAINRRLKAPQHGHGTRNGISADDAEVIGAWLSFMFTLLELIGDWCLMTKLLLELIEPKRLRWCT